MAECELKNTTHCCHTGSKPESVCAALTEELTEAAEANEAGLSVWLCHVYKDHELSSSDSSFVCRQKEF